MFGLDSADIIIALVGIAIALAFVANHTFRSSIQVRPRIERVVIRNIKGDLKVLGEGTHSLLPGWKEIDRVPISIQESSETGEEVKTINSIRLSLDERLLFVAGHQMTLAPGTTDWFDIDDSVATKDPTSDEMVILASTSIDPGKVTQPESIKKQVKLAVDSAYEVVFGMYTDEEILSPDKEGLLVPKNPIPGMPQRPATSISDLYDYLSEAIRRVANRSLAKIGIGLISVKITNLRYFEKNLQDATEKERRNTMLAEAANKTRLQLRDLNDQEALLVGENADFAKLASARAMQQGMSAIAGAIVSAAHDLRGVIPPPKDPPTT